MHIRIGTRGSALALAQTKKVVELLMQLDGRLEVEQVVIKTTGDVVKGEVPRAMNGTGFFVRELDEALVQGRIDLAVHSMKDIPTIRPPDTITAAVLERESPYDCLITRDGATMDELPAGALIGTSSLRRAYPELTPIPMRGNINTRLRKLNEGVCDGIVLAEAGLIRMGWSIERQTLSPSQFLPSCNQGVIACVCMQHSRVHELLAQTRGDNVKLTAEVLSPDGTQQIRGDTLIPLDDDASHQLQLADALAQKIAMSGGARLISLAKDES